MNWITKNDIGSIYRLTLKNNEKVTGLVEKTDDLKVELRLKDGRITKLKQSKIEEAMEVFLSDEGMKAFQEFSQEFSQKNSSGLWGAIQGLFKKKSYNRISDISPAIKEGLAETAKVGKRPIKQRKGITIIKKATPVSQSNPDTLSKADILQLDRIVHTSLDVSDGKNMVPDDVSRTNSATISTPAYTYESLLELIMIRIANEYFKNDITNLQNYYSVKELLQISPKHMMQMTNARSLFHIQKVEDLRASNMINNNILLILCNLLSTRVHKNSMSNFEFFMKRIENYFSTLNEEQKALHDHTNELLHERKNSIGVSEVSYLDNAVTRTQKADLYLFLQKNLKSNFEVGLEAIRFNRALIINNIDSFKNLVKNFALNDGQLKAIGEVVGIEIGDFSNKPFEVKKLDNASELLVFMQHNLKKDFSNTCTMIKRNKELIDEKKMEFSNIIRSLNLTKWQLQELEKRDIIDFVEIKELEENSKKIKLAAILSMSGEEDDLSKAVNILDKLYYAEQLPETKLFLYLGMMARQNEYDRIVEILESQIDQLKNTIAKIKFIKQLSFYYQKQGYVDKALDVLYKAMETYKDISKEDKVALLSQIILIKTKNNYNDGKSLDEQLSELERLDPYNLLRSKISQVHETVDRESEIDTLMEQEIEKIDYSTEFNNLDKFINFYLQSCEYKGVSATKAKEKTFTRLDYQQVTDLENIKSSKEKADRVLTAVQIGKKLGYEEELVNTKLIESLRFQARYYISQNRHDIAKNYLLTILYVLDESKKDNSYLHDILVEYFTTALKIQNPVEFSNLIKQIANKEETQNLIINLRLFSKKAFDQFYDKLQKDKDMFDLYESLFSISHLVNSDDLYQKIESDLKIVSNKRIDDDTIITLLDNINRNFFFELDKRYFSDFTNVFKEFHNIHTANSYEEKELIIERCKNQLEKLQSNIEESPAIFSINNLMDLISIFIKKLETYSMDLKTSTLPKLIVTTDMDTYTVNNGLFDFYITIENEENASPAKNIVVSIIDNDQVVMEKVVQKISGGKRETLAFPIPLDINDVDTFAISTQIEYNTVMDETVMLEKDFAISFEDAKKFDLEDKENPYIVSDIVTNRKMVYGRDKLIRDISDLLYQDKIKGVVLYGQKRSGKSTVFYWLQEEMKKRNNKFFTIYFSMGQVDNFDGFMRIIVRRIKKDYQKQFGVNIFDNIEENEKEIRDLSSFFDFLESVNDFLAQSNLKLLILIDEFTYLYEYLKSGQYPENFLKNWKALIQEDLFKSALIGQNSMPLFINDYPNELAIYKKEKISYLDKESAFRLIDEPICLKDGSTRYKEGAIELIYEYTNGSAFYIQKICYDLITYLKDRKSTYVTTAHVKDVISMMFESMTLEGDFDNLISLGDGAPLHIKQLREDAIKSIAHKSKFMGGTLFEEIELDCDDDTKQNVLKSLLDTDVLTVSQNGRYSIIVKLMEKFIQHSYQEIV